VIEPTIPVIIASRVVVTQLPTQIVLLEAVFSIVLLVMRVVVTITHPACLVHII
jgi:hypothetical protein